MKESNSNLPPFDRAAAPKVHPLPFLELPQWNEVSLRCGARLISFGSGACPAPVFQLKALVSGAGKYNAPGSIVADFLPIVIDQGAGNLSAAEVAERLESRGAWIRRKIHNRHVELTLMGLADTLPELLDTFLDVIVVPSFEHECFSSLAGMKARSLAVKLGKPMTLASREAKLRFWGAEHPASFASVPDDYLNLSRDEIAGFHAGTFRPGSMTFYLSGCLDESMVSLVADSLDRRLGAMEAGPQPAQHPDLSDLRHTEPGSYRLAIDGSSQAAIRILYPTIKRSHPDFELLRLAVTALGGYFGSRLTATLREEKGLTYDIRAALSADCDGSLIGVATECCLDCADEALELIYAEIERMAVSPPCGSELLRLTSYASTSLAASLDTPLTILDTATTYDIAGTDRDYFFRTQEAIRRATPDELARVVLEHLSVPPVEVTVK